MVQPGTYEAKISDYGVKQTNNGKTFIEIQFSVEGQGTVKWNGYLTEKTVERTFQTLAYCGLSGSDPTVLAEGPSSGALDMDSPMNILVEIQKDKDGAPTKYTQIRYINRISKPVSPEQRASAKAAMAQFTGDWMKVKTEMGIKSEPKSAVKLGF